MLDLNTINILKKQGHIIRSDNTLHGFTKARIVQMVRCLENNWAAALERCENQYKTLCGYHEKEKKYGWRDLRNDPENLPEVNSFVLCEWAGGSHNWHDVFLFDNDPRPHFRNTHGDMISIIGDEKFTCEGQVIEWRYIENFDLRKE